MKLQIVVITATLFSVLLSACEELMDGECGLRGRKVECINDGHCQARHLDYCDDDGSCKEGRVFCGPTGFECESGDLICGYEGKCTLPCNSHDECLPGDYCSCFPSGMFSPETMSAGWCITPRCTSSGTCPPGTIVVSGSLACWPMSRVGDCMRAPGMPDCPPGFEPDGEN